MALGAKLNVSFQGRFLAFRNPLDPYNGNPFGLFYFSDFLEFVDTLVYISPWCLQAGDHQLMHSDIIGSAAEQSIRRYSLSYAQLPT